MSIERREREFNQLTTQAMCRLERPQDTMPTETVNQLRPYCRLWHYPSFGVYKSWLVFVPYKEKNLGLTMVRQVFWNRPGDFERFTNPFEGLKRGLSINPTIDVTDATVKLEDLFQELSLLKDICIPISGFAQHIGLDG